MGGRASGAAAGRRALRPVLVLALDGATFDVIAPMVAAGRLPHLAGWIGTGVAGPLPSTTPPVTFPAWSSFMTGLEPGQHGIFDFTQKLPGEYRIRFVNATDRVGESIHEATSRLGGRVLVLGLPATFPPAPVEGLLVPGFDAPVSSASDAAGTSDPALYARIASRVGPWMRPDIDETAVGGDFHERAIGTLLARIDRKRRFALAAIDEMRTRDGRGPDLGIVVFSESDTVGHHYWRDHDPASPRHDAGASAARRDAIAAVYEALDAACAEIRSAFGPHALCLVVSDHGMGGAARHVVHLNRYLAERGLLVRSRRRGVALDRAARTARDVALRVLPQRLAGRLFRRARTAAARLESAARFGGIDFERTLAFSEEANTQPGVWINLRGRERRGAVGPGDYEAVRDRVIAELLAWRLPDGAPVVARAVRREAVHRGPFVDRAPDIVVELAAEAGYGLSLVPTPWTEEARGPRASPDGVSESRSIRRLTGSDLAGGRGRGMNGTHRQDGIFIASRGQGDGGSVFPLPGVPSSLVAVAPIIADALGIEWSPGGGEAGSVRVDYSAEEDALVAGRLRALGYLD